MKSVMTSRLCAFSLIFLMFFSMFSIGVYAQDSETRAVSDENVVVFDLNIAGVTPDSFWYIFDFTHTPEEAIHEMGLMVEAEDYESYLGALENFNEAVSEEINAVESVSLRGVTLESLESGGHDGAQTLENIQVKVLEYEEYLNAIEEDLDEQVNDGAITETQAESLVDELDKSVNEIGSVVEEGTQELINVVADNSGVSKAEVELVYEDNFQDQYGGRFSEISSIQDILELEAKIVELKEEASRLREEGNLEQATAVDRLLTLAESHGENCLNSEKGNLEVEAVNHINAAERLIDNVERFLDGEYGSVNDDETYKLVPASPYEEEDVRRQIEDDGDDAIKFTEDYETLKEKYADSPEELAYIEQEKERAGKVQELTIKLSDEGVLDKWFQELRAEGLSEGEVIAQVHEKFVDEYEVANGHYDVPGLYVLPGDDGRPDADEEIVAIEGGQNLEVIEIGRIEIIETIDSETGEVKKEIVGWWDSDGDGKGEFVDDVKEGGGFALGVPYEFPSGETVTYGTIGYTITTEAGVTSNVNYPEGYTPSLGYNYGDEAFTLRTEEGDKVTYSATGYKIEDAETGETLVEEAYLQEAVVFADGSSLDNEPTGYVFNDDDGEAYVYSYNPETESFTDATSGKVFVSPTMASHTVSTVYDSATGVYRYNYGGSVWATPGDGMWTSPTGQVVGLSVVPAPVGYEDEGRWTTKSGKDWVFDSTARTWIETTANSKYVVAPNNLDRFDEESGGYVDAKGRWYDSSGQGSGDYVRPWNYDSTRKQWVSSDTGDIYDPSTGNIIRPDGTIEGPENRPAGEGSEGISCYGCYYQGGGGTSGTSETRTYTYDYGGHYERRVDGSYGYIRPDGEYQGRTSATDAQGNVWTRNSDGSWISSSGESYIPGSEDYYSGPYSGESNYDYGEGGYTGGGGWTAPTYDASGNIVSQGTYVGGAYGGWTADGTYTGGNTYTQNPDGTWSSTDGGTTYSDSTYSGTTSTSETGDSGTTSTSSETTSSSGGDSGSTSSGSTSGGDGGGSSSGSTSGGGVTGGAIADEGASLKSGNWFVRFFKWVFGK